MEEIWRDVKGYEGLYQVSNFGRVKSLAKYKNGNGGSKFWIKEKILKPKKMENGYLRVVLHKNGEKKYFQVHRIVYEAFVGKIPQGMQVNHINEIKSDNRLENLNLMTPKENANWGTRNERISEKLKISGKKGIYNTKLSKPVLQIDKNTNEVIAEFPSAKEVHRQLGYSQGHISACCRMETKQSYGYIWRYK